MMDWWQAAKQNRVFFLVLVIAVAAILFDQLTKLLILHGVQLMDQVAVFADGTIRKGHVDLSPIFDLTYVENRGVSFGLFAGGWFSRVVLTLLALTVSGFILHWAGRLTRQIAAIGAGLIVGGAVGNAIDRIFYGYVVDFLDFSGLMFPWQFNIADVCINIGVACLAYDAFFLAPKTDAETATVGPKPDETSVTYSSEDPKKTDQPPNLTDSIGE